MADSLPDPNGIDPATAAPAMVPADGESGRPRLAFDLDVDVCVIGAGLAGLTAAREIARGGMSVAVLEGRSVGWSASGHTLGSVMPGYALAPADLIERVGFDQARALWALAQEGADYVRATATSDAAAALTEGALEVSTVDAGDRIIGRLQTLSEDFATDVEGWQTERVRATLKSERYFHAIHYPKAFQIDGRRYVHRLAALAEEAGARIFEDTPVVGIDPAGIRKRVVTPSARLRCGHVVMAGNVHLGEPGRRLASTLLPVWRYVAVTAPLGERLAETIAFPGAVTDSDGIDQFRVVEGDRLMWSGPETVWQGDPARHAKRIRRRIATVFPQLAPVEIAEAWSGVFGQTVHAMPQIGEVQPGVWVLGGFGRQGLATTATGGLLVARGIVHGDRNWRQFAPFELVWAGGTAGRIAGQAADAWSRGQAATLGALARLRERARNREQAREATRTARIAAARTRAADR
jgi:glycine/D-amino acid oxidase-like deaminating enzyme